MHLLIRLFYVSADGIGEKKYDLGFNRATSPHQTGSTMKPIGAYALALDYKLINYSSQILDSPYYSAEDKKVLKDQYIGVMSPFSEAAQSRSDVWRAWPTNYGGAGGQGNPMLVYDALQQSYNTVAVWVGDMVGVDYLYNFVHDTLECSYINAENDMDLGPLVLGSQSSGLTVVQLAGAYTIFNTGTFTTPHYYTEITDYQGNMILDNNKYINTKGVGEAERRRALDYYVEQLLPGGAWSEYHNIFLSVRSLDEALYYWNAGVRNAMFCIEISTPEQFRAFERSGIPWSYLIAASRKAMDPAMTEIYEKLHDRGVMVIVSITGSADRVKDRRDRRVEYLRTLLSEPDIIETDYPADFVGLPVGREELRAIRDREAERMER